MGGPKMAARFAFIMAQETKFKGVELVTKIFGHWPSFHDAEIKWLRLDVAGSESEDGPTLEFLMHCFEMTNEVSPEGFYVLKNHTSVHFRFHQVRDVKLSGFTKQNAIFSLEINEQSDPTWEQRDFEISIEASSGLGGTFHSPFPEILSATSCDAKGNVLTM
jgi:hypothetical protein